MNTSLVNVAKVTIAAGQTTSSAINLNGRVDAPNGLRLFSVIAPSEMTGTAFTVLSSRDGGATFRTLNYNGIAVSIPASTGKEELVDPVIFSSVTHLKLVSNATEAAAREIGLVLRAI